MKRYVCTVAAGILLALVSTGTATASGLPVLGQSGTQATSFGDQTVGEQSNDATVTQKQGNGNVNVSPAIAVFGDAETTSAQGNENTATAAVDQSSSVDQTQSSTQHQSLDESGPGCCGGPSQTAGQTVYGGDQTVGEQYNGSDVSQYQGNGNVNVSPAIAVFGDATTGNAQGNANSASADVDQSNEATQSESSTQKQSVGQGRGHCCDGPSQTAEQTTSFGDQSVGEQRNDATVTQKQGNGNVNVSPAIAVFGDAETANYQGNGNRADASVTQLNEATQSQSSTQKQSAWRGGQCCKRTIAECDQHKRCEPRPCCWESKPACCDYGQSQTGQQHASFGDQTVREQRNDAEVTQKQGNGNLNVSPAIGLAGGKEHSCRSKCSKLWKPWNGDATTTNYQGNGNRASAHVDQSNSAEQSQVSYQRQWAVDTCKRLIYR